MIARTYKMKDYCTLIGCNYFLLLDLLSFQLTTYTTLMQVSEGKLESYIRDCPNPCMPW